MVVNVNIARIQEKKDQQTVQVHSELFTAIALKMFQPAKCRQLSFPTPVLSGWIGSLKSASMQIQSPVSAVLLAVGHSGVDPEQIGGLLTAAGRLPH